MAASRLDPEDLRRRLRGRLPDYMVPADIVILTAMPLGDNAKVDRAALPEPARQRRTGVVVAPRDEYEVAVAEVGAMELHGRAEIGVAVVAADAAHVNEVLDRCERLVVGRPEVELLSVKRRWYGDDD